LSMSEPRYAKENVVVLLTKGRILRVYSLEIPWGDRY
jgi:hypothetical protein